MYIQYGSDLTKVHVSLASLKELYLQACVYAFYLFLIFSFKRIQRNFYNLKNLFDQVSRPSHGSQKVLTSLLYVSFIHLWAHFTFEFS